jgi:hypothetical protein
MYGIQPVETVVRWFKTGNLFFKNVLWLYCSQTSIMKIVYTFFIERKYSKTLKFYAVFK